MRTVLKFLMLVAIALPAFGCAQNYYNIPRDTYEKKVRVLGVAPIFADGDSDIRHPDREAILALVRDQNRKNEPELVARLKETGAYLSVRMADANADDLFSNLLFRRERRSDAGVAYNKYFYKQPELKDLIEKNGFDAVMLVVVSGLTKSDKIYSSNYLAFLESDYNYLIMTAQILDADGNLLWEYPNFQQRLLSLTPLLNLQYPDFDEADANMTDKVDVKMKTVPGIARIFAKTASSVRDNGSASKPYSVVFDQMVSLQKPPFRFPWQKGEKKVEEPPTPVPAVSPQPKPAASIPAKPEPKETASPMAKEDPASATHDPVPLQPEEIKTENLSPETK